MTNPPKINPNFIYKVKFKGRLGKATEVLILSADGYIDYAHQIGIKDIDTNVIDLTTDVEESGARTRWVTVKAVVKLKNGISTSGLSTTSSRGGGILSDKPWFATSLAETRAIKRAIAAAANITEDMIREAVDDSANVPTREFVDVPLESEEKEIPEHLRKTIVGPGGEEVDVGPGFVL